MKNHRYTMHIGFSLVFMGASSLQCQEDVTSLFDHKIIPLLVIGGGVSGLAAAEYAARSHIPTVLFTGDKPGGQIIDALEVENVPGLIAQPGLSIIDRLEQQAITFGAHLVHDSITEIVPTKVSLPMGIQAGFSVTTQSGETLCALAIIVATGASPRTLGVEGEQQYWGRGVHTCPRCDALFYKGKNVIVVGGGDTAIEYAEFLASYARQVTILVRAPLMRAAARLQSRLTDYDNVDVVYHQRVIRIVGENERVTHLAIEDVRTGEQSVLRTDALFLAIGHEPATNLVRSLVELTPTGHIYLAKRNQATSCNGIFSAGDVDDNEYRQAVVAGAEGAMAALDAVKYLHEKGITENCIRRLWSANRLLYPQKNTPFFGKQ